MEHAMVCHVIMRVLSRGAFSRVILDAQSNTGIQGSLPPLGVSIVSIVVLLICRLLRHSLCSILQASSDALSHMTVRLAPKNIRSDFIDDRVLILVLNKVVVMLVREVNY